MIWLKIAIMVAIVAAASYAVYAYNTAIAEAAEQRELAAKIAGERDGWIDVAANEAAKLQIAEKIASAREAARRNAEKERDDGKRELAALRAAKPEVALWWNQPVPADLIERLRRDPNVEAVTAVERDRVPSAAPRTDADPRVRRLDERGSLRAPR